MQPYNLKQSISHILATKFKDMTDDFFVELTHFQESFTVYSNNVPIVFCADENYARYLPVVIQSIIEHASKDHFYNIIIFDCSENKRLVHSYVYPILKRQIEQKSNFSLHVINIYPILEAYSGKFQSANPSRFPAAIFGRFFVPDLLPMFDKAIYSDLDAIYQSDLRVLMTIDLRNNVIAACADVYQNTFRLISEDIGKRISEIIKLDDDTLYVCSGILVFNIKAWQENNILDQISIFLSNNRLDFADQDALNFACKGKILYLNQKYGCMTLEDDENKLSLSALALSHYADLVAEYRQANISTTTFVQFVGSVKPWFSIDVIKGDLWWAYCSRTEVYSRLFLEACDRFTNPQKHQKEEKELRFLFLPILKIKTNPSCRLYKIFGVNIAKRIKMPGRIRYYVFGLNFFTLKVFYEEK